MPTSNRRVDDSRLILPLKILSKYKKQEKQEKSNPCVLWIMHVMS